MVKRILLIASPRMSYEKLNRDKLLNEVYPPLGLLYLSSFVKRELADIEIEVYDLHLETIKESFAGKTVNWIEMANQKVLDFKPDMVGISTMFGASFPTAESIGRHIRKYFPQTIIVCGGVHITGLSKTKEKDTLDFCDFVCLNEAEYHFLNLIKYLRNESSTLNGVLVMNESWLREKTDICKGNSIPENIDTLPIPDFHAIDLQNYYKYGILSGAQSIPENTPVATLLTTRGCIARCTFCSVRNFNGPTVRSHSAQRVLEEVDLLYHKFGIRHVDFVDDDFTHSRKRSIDIFQGLIDRKYKFTWSIGNGIRLGTLDDELLHLMAASGCTYFSMGIESGDPEMLKKVRKPLNIPMLKKGAELLKRHPGIYYRANFITGFPDETPEQLGRTFSVAEELGVDWCLFSICKPLPDTEMYNNLLENKTDYEGVGNSTANDYSFGTATGMVAKGEEGKDIFDLTYNYNLKINFKNNPNMHGRNIPRAIKDFERITKIAADHAFAWNCLAIAYKEAKMADEKRNAIKKVNEIVTTNKYWAQKFEDLDFKFVS